MQAGAPEQGEPDVGHDRAENRNGKHQLADAAAAADASGEQSHQWCIPKEPAPVEDRPSVDPVARRHVGRQGHPRQVDQICEKAAEEVLDQPQARPEQQQPGRHGERQPDVEFRQPLDPLLNAADGGAGEDSGEQHHHQRLQPGAVAEPGQLAGGVAELQREKPQGANRAGNRGDHRQPIGQVTDRSIHPAPWHDIHQQGAWPERLAPPFQDRKGDGGGGGHQGPGEKAPVQKAHRQGRIHGFCGAALDAVKNG